MSTAGLLNVAQAAELLGISGRRAYQLLHDGILPSERIGSQIVIKRADVERLARDGWPGRRRRST
jgi:excisionase family DNA binding protein